MGGRNASEYSQHEAFSNYFDEEPAPVISFFSDTVQEKDSWTKNPCRQIQSNKIAPKQKY